MHSTTAVFLAPRLEPWSQPVASGAPLSAWLPITFQHPSKCTWPNLPAPVGLFGATRDFCPLLSPSSDPFPIASWSGSFWTARETRLWRYPRVQLELVQEVTEAEPMCIMHATSFTHP